MQNASSEASQALETAATQTFIEALGRARREGAGWRG